MNPVVYVVLAVVLVVVLVLIVKAFKKGETPLPVKEDPVDPIQFVPDEPRKPGFQDGVVYKSTMEFLPEAPSVSVEPVVPEVKPAKKRGAPKKKAEPVVKMTPKKVSKK